MLGWSLHEAGKGIADLPPQVVQWLVLRFSVQAE